MEEVFEILKSAIESIVFGEFVFFKSDHEAKLNHAPSISTQITEDAMLEVAKNPCIRIKDLFEEANIIKYLYDLEPDYIEKLVEGKVDLNEIKNEHFFSLWIEYLLCKKKQEYLQNLKSSIGITKRPFNEYLNIKSEIKKDLLIDTLESICNQGSGKVLAITVIALEEAGLLLPYKSRSSLFDALKSTFTNIGSKKGFQDQYRQLTNNKDSITLNEIDRIKNILKSI